MHLVLRSLLALVLLPIGPPPAAAAASPPTVVARAGASGSPLERAKAKRTRRPAAASPSAPVAASGAVPNLLPLAPGLGPWFVYATDDAVPNPAVLPLALVGGSGATTLVVSGGNANAGTGSVLADIGLRVDGVAVGQVADALLPELPGVTPTHALPGITVAGGRHTASLWLDPANAIAESAELDNRTATQWVWRPDTLAFDAPQVRTDVPVDLADTEFVQPGQTVWPNCIGLRTPDLAPVGADGFWSAAGLMSTPLTDYDLDLHPLSTHPGDGFAAPLASSYFDQAVPDFVLQDHDPAAGGAGQPTRFDLGILWYSGPLAAPATVQLVRSRFVDNASGIFTTDEQTLGPGQFLALFELGAYAPLTVRLDNLAGGADLALHVVSRAQVAGPRVSGVDLLSIGGAAWVDVTGPGGDELTSASGLTSRPAVLVRKSGPNEIGKTARFRLSLYTQPLSAADAAPPALRLLGARPNPVRAGSALDYELPRTGEASLEVLDLAGRRVLQLAAGPHAAGRHSVRWDGRDTAGRPLPGGLYFARLVSGGETRISKLTVAR